MKNAFFVSLLFLSFQVFAANADEVKVEANEETESKLDFGDYASSTLTGKAWESLTSKKYDDAIGFAKECIKRYEKDAIAMQKQLTEPVDAGDKEAVQEKWALNDVGTCYFIAGQALEKQDKSDKAIETYKRLLKNVPFAQCWDPQGWFWKPADAAKKQLKTLEFEKLNKE